MAGTARSKAALLGFVAATVLLAGCTGGPGFGTGSGSDLGSHPRVLTNTSELRPGTFVSFGSGGNVSDDLLIGTHPHATAGPVPVTVTETDPTGESAFNSRRQQVAEVGPFYEISADNIDGPFLRTPVDTGFFVTLPVPARLDSSKLGTLVYMDGNWTHSNTSDAWLWHSGTYDPEHALFLVPVPNLGDGEHPIRVGLVEHKTKPTRNRERILTPILDKHFPRLETGSVPGGSGTSPNKTRAGLGFTAAAAPPSPVSLDHRGNHRAEWTFICRTDRCPQNNITTVRTALNEALDVYKNLDNSPRPSIGTTTGSKFRPQVSTYRINLQSESTRSKCPRSIYVPPLNKVIVCIDAWKMERNDPTEDPLNHSAAHELFHAMQFNLANAFWGIAELEVLEATAKLSEDWENKAQTTMERPDVNIPLSWMEYNASYFYAHLLETQGIAWKELGDHFDDGLRFKHLEQFVAARTSGDLGDAYWDFAKDMVYENDPSIGRSRGDCRVDTGYGRKVLSNGQSFGGSGDVPDDVTRTGRSISPLSSRVWNLSLPSQGYDPYRLKVTLSDFTGPILASPPGDAFRMKLYDDNATDWDRTHCRSDANESVATGTVSLPVYDRSKNATLLVGDLVVRQEVNKFNADPAHGYTAKFTFEKIPEKDVPYPIAKDLQETVPASTAGSTGPSVAFNVTENATNPAGPKSRLTLVPPSGSGVSTAHDNDVRFRPGKGEVVFSLSNEDFFGTDSYKYTIEDERTGLQAEGTVTVERSGEPTAVDDRVPIDRSVAQDWKAKGWNASAVSPITFDVVGNDENPLDFSGSSWDRSLTITDVSASHGKVKVVTVDGVDKLRYWPNATGEEAWSSNSDGSRFYNDDLTYTIQNDIDKRDTASVDVLYFKPDTSGFGGEDGPPQGSVCSAAANGGGYGAVTLMRDGTAEAHVREPGAGWTALEGSGAQVPAVQALDGDGLATGWTLDSSTGSEAWIWSKENGLRDLETPEGQGSFALGVHDGRVVGQVYDPSGEGQPRAGVWTDGSLQPIGDDLSGASVATAAGSDGTVVGVHGWSASDGYGDTVLEGIGCEDIDQGPPIGVGGGDDDPKCPGGRFSGLGARDGEASGFLANVGPDGEVGDITQLLGPDRKLLIPRDVNAEGEVPAIIPKRKGGPVCPTTAMVWSSGGAQRLGGLQEGSYSDAYAIADDGLVAGVAAEDGTPHGVVWDRGGDSESPQIVDLDRVVDLGSGWRIEAATGFTGDGQAVVLAENPDGDDRPVTIDTDKLPAD